MNDLDVIEPKPGEPLSTAGVRCERCDYDLSALEPDGKCPECEHSILDSIGSEVARREERVYLLENSDLTWIRGLREAAFLCIIAMLLLVTFAFLPEWAFKRRSPERVMTLVLAVTALVIAQFAAWKLLAPEPMARAQYVSRIGRVCCLVLLSAIAIGFALSEIKELLFPIILAGFISAVGVSATTNMRLATIANRGGSITLWFSFIFITPFAAIQVILAMMPQSHGPEDSLSMITNAPTATLGAANTLRELVWTFRQSIFAMNGVDEIYIIIIALFQFLRCASIAWLAHVLTKAVRIKSATQDSPGNTAASFRP